MTRNFSDFYDFLPARLKDSLALTNDQMRQMEEERQLLRHKADSIYTGLATYLVNLPDASLVVTASPPPARLRATVARPRCGC
jgi:hypothetical protein